MPQGLENGFIRRVALAVGEGAALGRSLPSCVRHMRRHAFRRGGLTGSRAEYLAACKSGSAHKPRGRWLRRPVSHNLLQSPSTPKTHKPQSPSARPCPGERRPLPAGRQERGGPARRLTTPTSNSHHIKSGCAGLGNTPRRLRLRRQCLCGASPRGNPQRKHAVSVSTVLPPRRLPARLLPLGRILRRS